MDPLGASRQLLRREAPAAGVPRLPQGPRGRGAGRVGPPGRICPPPRRPKDAIAGDRGVVVVP